MSRTRILAKALNCLNADGPTTSPCGDCESRRAVAEDIDTAKGTGGVTTVAGQRDCIVVQWNRMSCYCLPRLVTRSSSIGLQPSHTPAIRSSTLADFNSGLPNGNEAPITH